MKKLTAIFIAVLLVIGCFSVMAASAADTATITVDGKTYTVDVGKTLTYTVNLKTVHKITNGEFYLGYPQSVLTIANDDAFDFPVVGKSSVTYNYKENIENEFRFNFSNQANPIDFTNGGVLVTINFTVTAAGSGSIGFINEESSTPGELTRETVLSWVDTDYSINDELPNATFTETLTGYNPDVPTSQETQSTDPTGTQATDPTGSTQATDPTGSTQATDPTGSTQATDPTGSTQATETPASTEITVKAAKTSIYVGGTTKVTATVTNPVGATVFKSSNTSVATVKVSGNIATVTAKKAGSVTITATNNSKSASVKITIVKRANPMTVKAKACSAKAKKNTTIKKATAFTIKNAKGTVTFKKASGDKKITINKKTGNITVKKGLKKGKTFKLKVKVTAAGNTTYKAITKTVTVKIKIK